MSDQHIQSARLDSWKSVAAYLGRDVRTAIRWEQERGLPVHRLPGDARSGVFAFRNEIDAWLKGQTTAALREPDAPEPAALVATTADAAEPSPQTNHRSLRRWWRSAAVVLLSSAAVAFALHLHAARGLAQPTSITFTSASLQAWDDDHHLLWEYRLPQPLLETGKAGDNNPRSEGAISYEETNHVAFYDLLGDGRREALALVHYARGGSFHDDPRQVLLCLSPSGKLLWSYEPQDVLTFGPRTYGAPWELLQWTVSDEPGPKTIWVNVAAYTWGKSFVARLDAQGHAAIQFVQSGEIAALERFHTPHGALLWIGGFNDEYDTASLAILRDDQPFAVSPQTAGSHYACSSCGSGDPLAYFVFPRYDLSRITHNPNNKVDSIHSAADIVQISQAELSRSDRVLYDFSNDAQPKPLRVNYASSFWPNHLEFERQGKIHHSLAECPDRLHPPAVRLYQNGVWSDIHIPSVFTNE